MILSAVDATHLNVDNMACTYSTLFPVANVVDPLWRLTRLFPAIAISNLPTSSCHHALPGQVRTGPGIAFAFLPLVIDVLVLRRRQTFNFLCNSDSH